MSSPKERSSFTQAAQDPNWQRVMLLEIEALEKKNTWTVTSLPLGKKAIGYKWVFKNKFNADGSLERCKACLITKGYTQQEGINYLETFSIIAKLTTVKVVIALVAFQD